MNKKFLIALPLALMLTIGLTACDNNSDNSDNKDNNPGGDNHTPVSTIEYDTAWSKDDTYHWHAAKGTGNEGYAADLAKHSYGADGKCVCGAEKPEEIVIPEKPTLSVWDGVTPAEEPEEGFEEDAENCVWHITSAAGLAYWADLVNCEESGTVKTSKYSTFNNAYYQNAALTQSKEAAMKIGFENGSKAWTLSLEIDIDLAGYEWTPISTFQFGLNGLIFEGNGHTISNMYCPASILMGSTQGGFFGQWYKDDLTVRNVTFDGAEVVTNGSNTQNLGVLIGFAASSNRMDTGSYLFETPQTIEFENVHVINSKIGGYNARKVGCFIGRAGQFSAGTDVYDYTVFTFKNCTATDNEVVAWKIAGGLIGYAAYYGDSDPAYGGGLTVIANDTYVTNNTVITLDQSKQEGETDFGTLCSGDSKHGSYAEDGIVYSKDLPSYYGCTNTLINLASGYTCAADTTASLSTALQAGMDNDEYTNKAIFVLGDIDMTSVSSAATFLWEPNDEQVIYLVNGAQITGLDLGDTEVRYIDGTRNDDGDLNVKDADGTIIGAWVLSATGSQTGTRPVDVYVGAFVSAEADDE